jgi:hypothetical protein
VPDDLMAEYERQLRVGQLTVDDVEIGTADAAGCHPDEHLARRRVRHRKIPVVERTPWSSKHERAH